MVAGVWNCDLGHLCCRTYNQISGSRSGFDSIALVQSHSREQQLLNNDRQAQITNVKNVAGCIELSLKCRSFSVENQYKNSAGFIQTKLKREPLIFMYVFAALIRETRTDIFRHWLFWFRPWMVLFQSWSDPSLSIFLLFRGYLGIIYADIY